MKMQLAFIKYFIFSLPVFFGACNIEVGNPEEETVPKMGPVTQVNQSIEFQLTGTRECGEQRTASACSEITVPLDTGKESQVTFELSGMSFSVGDFLFDGGSKLTAPTAMDFFAKPALVLGDVEQEKIIAAAELRLQATSLTPALQLSGSFVVRSPDHTRRIPVTLQTQTALAQAIVFNNALQNLASIELDTTIWFDFSAEPPSATAALKGLLSFHCREHNDVACTTNADAIKDILAHRILASMRGSWRDSKNQHQPLRVR